MEREFLRPHEGIWVLRIVARGRGIPKSVRINVGEGGGGEGRKSWKTPGCVMRLFTSSMLLCCMVFIGSCNGNNFQKLQSWRVFDNSLHIEIVVEAQIACFCQTQLDTLLNASAGKILGAYLYGYPSRRRDFLDIRNIEGKYEKKGGDSKLWSEVSN